MIDDGQQHQLNCDNIDNIVNSEEISDEMLQNNSYLASESSDYGEDWGVSSSNSKNGNDKCNLIINYLPHSIDDAALLVLFSEYGEISMAKVVKDKASKKSLGYGFVKFVNESDALAAVEAKNGYPMGHKKLKVSIARPASDEIRNCKLYVTNLPKEMTEKDVLDLFQPFGEIIECRVLKDHRNVTNSKGVAFIQYNLKSQANNALSLNGFRPPGSDRFLVVKYAEDQHKKIGRRNPMSGQPDHMKIDINDQQYYGYPQSRMMYEQNNILAAQNSSSGMMYATNIAPNMSYMMQRGGKNSQSRVDPSIAMAEWFPQGMPYGAQVGYDPMTEYSRAGQGTVFMRSPRIVHEGGYSGSVTLSISNLPSHADVALLHDLFAPYGRVLSAQIDVTSPDSINGTGGGLCSGRGHIQMAGLAHAQYSTQALNGAVLSEGGYPLQVSIVYGNTTRTSQNNQQHKK